MAGDADDRRGTAGQRGVNATAARYGETRDAAAVEASVTHLAMVGCGHVGLVSAACFAELGHTVDCIDIDAERIALLRAGRSPIHEPQLERLLKRGIAEGRLRFHERYPEPLDAEIVFVAVSTPEAQDGAADLRAVRDAISAMARWLKPGSIIVNKSTVPVGTAELVESMAARGGARDVSVVSNPEFLQEGSAVESFMRPARVVLGASDADAAARVAALYEPLGVEPLLTDVRTAEMIKYASNAFLATKISFINEIAAICETLGADVSEVAAGMGSDPRIGSEFLRAGLGWGGSCFPKDVQSLAHMAAAHGAHPQLLRSVMDINANQRRRVTQKLRESLGGLENRRILVLGAAFKPHTDDVRHSPALELAELLALEGASVVVSDPVVRPEAILGAFPELEFERNVYTAAKHADAAVLATEWPEFRELDLEALGAAMSRRLLIDARNFLEPAHAQAAGFEYRCVGRPLAEHPGKAATVEARAAVPAEADHS